MSSGGKVRVLVIDDSAAIRRLLTDVLTSDPEIEVVGTAATGNMALMKFGQLQPDVVTLDVELPDRSGLDVLVDLRAANPRVPIIMFSSLTRRAASTTLDALARGATDYVAKPTDSESFDSAVAAVRDQLVAKVKHLGRPLTKTPPSAPAALRTTKRAPVGNVSAIAVGASTGGPNALADLLRAIPAPAPVPIFIVQHMPPVFTQILSERLTTHSKHVCAEARHGELVSPGRVYLAPGDFHMRVVRHGPELRIELNQDAPENACRPAVDVLFRSIAETYEDRTLAVVLTGMGQDGLLGCERLRAKGCRIMAQDEASSVVWGMPGAVVRAGLVDEVGDIAALGDGLARVCSQIIMPRPLAQGSKEHQTRSASEDRQ